MTYHTMQVAGCRHVADLIMVWREFAPVTKYAVVECYTGIVLLQIEIGYKFLLHCTMVSSYDSS